MKKLAITNAIHLQLLKGFKRHLEQINYSTQTIYNANNSAREYVHYINQNNLDFNTVNPANYFDYLQKRSNNRRDGGLSIAYLHKHRSFLKLFHAFLLRSKGIKMPVFPNLPRPKSAPKVLTIKQVEQLFKTCDNSLLGKRNKAVLAVYYGLGLRRKEGASLQVDQLDFGKEEVFVAQSKTSTQRIVPMSDHVKDILDDYMYNVREKLVPKDKSTSELLVTERGKPLSVESVSYIIKRLVEASKIKTPASAHTLRHSVATHLLQAGMSLENIALFLGHTSLDSTQIYTHLTEPGSNEQTLKTKHDDTI
jgi:integrase/recombinase XerD